MTLQGTTADVVRQAITASDPLVGTRGFAGQLPDGRLVRDVLGRFPLYTQADDPTSWSFSPADLTDPQPVPPGTIRSERGDRRVWDLPDPEPEGDERLLVDRIRSAIETSVGAVQQGDGGGVAVAFSGGVDSAVVAALLDCPAYVVGFPGSHDLAAAETAARSLGLDLRVIELSSSELETAVPVVARAIGRTNAMDVQIALPLYVAAVRARDDGFDHLAVGQGADELFGGYAKVANAPDDHRIEADTIRGAQRELIRTLPDQLPRDVLAIRSAGVEPVAPLLDDRVVASALSLPGSLLVNERGERKWAFRLAAREFVPDSIAFREKKAVQYGSLVARELDRLARQAGFKRRMGDHVSTYVQSRL